jgi:hypothetical protein
MRNRPLPAPLETPWTKTRLKPCRERSSGLYGSWNRRVKTEIPDKSSIMSDDPRYQEFRKRFAAMSDEELIGAFNREVGNPGWVASRGFYLLALHDEFENRGFDYSAIGSKGGLSLRNTIKLAGKKIESLGARTKRGEWHKLPRMMQVIPFIWKTPIVAIELLVGAIGANQAGWSGAELVVNAPLMGPIEGLLTSFMLIVGATMAVGPVVLVHRIAKPALWLMVPILLYSALVPGVWNGFAGDFDATRLEAMKHHFANAYALQHMNPRGRFRTCEDERIELTDDAKAVCARTLNVAPGERIPGSEHRCGLLGMSSCFNTAPQK